MTSEYTSDGKDEHAEFYHRRDILDLQFIHARYVQHRFARHVHEHYVIGIVEEGLQTFNHRGAKQQTFTGGIILLNPDEAHTGEAATDDGFTYKALYPTVALMQSLLTDTNASYGQIPYFTSSVLYDPDLTARLLHLHRILTVPDLSLEAETYAYNVLHALIAQDAETRYRPISTGSERTAIRTICDYLHAHYDRRVSLNELAVLVSFSPYYLARIFKRDVGIPPHAYLESLRIQNAQSLLIAPSAADRSLADIALATGFCDQSHFTNRFRRMVGVTPSQYAKQDKILQERMRMTR